MSCFWGLGEGRSILLNIIIIEFILNAVGSSLGELLINRVYDFG